MNTQTKSQASASDAANEHTPLEILERQKAAQLEEPIPSAKVRKDRLSRAIEAAKEFSGAIAEAANADFGVRSLIQTSMTDVIGGVESIKYARKHVDAWMAPSRRAAAVPFRFFGSKVQVHRVPAGVVGSIVPWNFPVGLSLMPLGSIFAGGNRVMIKPSEHAPASADVIYQMFAKHFSPEEVAVIRGGVEVSAEFASLPFDHLLYTGGGTVAKHVMRAAAENLTPVTLELGGKSPVIVGESADPELVAKRVMFGKTLNAGQICLAPDYVLARKEDTQSLVDSMDKAVGELYPDGLRDSEDYTSIINQDHFERIVSLVQDAKDKGAEIVEFNPQQEDFSQQPHRKIPPTAILGATDDMKIMQEEIFGPVLPIKEVASTQKALEHVASNDTPLGLYFFGKDQKEIDHVVENSSSGGVTINDVISHIQQQSAPFGGKGPSGMGAYQGHEGFLNFTQARTVYRQTTWDPMKIGEMLRPPYKDGKLKSFLDKQIAGLK